MNRKLKKAMNKSYDGDFQEIIASKEVRKKMHKTYFGGIQITEVISSQSTLNSRN